MKQQIINIKAAITTKVGQAITAETVAELLNISADTDSAIAVVTINSNRGTTTSGALMINPEDWAATVRAELEEEDYPSADDIESVTETSCTDDGKKSMLAVELSSGEWFFDYTAGTATRYACPECAAWCESKEAAAECCD